jgi:hypothetical protein
MNEATPHKRNFTIPEYLHGLAAIICSVASEDSEFVAFQEG